jgi:hypothetical protein
VANSSSLYFTAAAAPGGPAGWSKLWYDIGFGVLENEQGLLLGGMVSMDMYLLRPTRVRSDAQLPREGWFALHP